MKKLLVILVTFSYALGAQQIKYCEYDTTSGVMSNAQKFPTNAVADDFGPRDLGDDWHGGVDFNKYHGAGDSQKWDFACAPDSGYFPDFNQLIKTGYKYGLINFENIHQDSVTMLFGHVFDDNRQIYDKFDSKIVLKYCDEPFIDSWGLIVISAEDTIVYGQISGATISHNGDSYETTNFISRDDPFLPLGNSGGDYLTHLHLAIIPFDTETSTDVINKNPLRYLEYDTASYEIEVACKQSESKFNFVYPGSKFSSIRVRPILVGETEGTKRYSQINGVDFVDIRCKHIDSVDFEHFQSYDTTTLIGLGGMLDSSLQNHKRNYNYPGNIHDYKRNGINSRAYNGMAQGANKMDPWDDYFFVDIFTRIHKNDSLRDGMKEFADMPSHVRYSDGDYLLQVRVGDISGDTTYLTWKDTLDNFYPHIEEVSTKILGYDASLQEVFAHDPSLITIDDGYIFGGNRQTYPIDLPPTPPLGSDLRIEVRTSEPMDTLSVSLPELFPPPSLPFGMTAIDSTRSVWTVEINGLLSGTGIQMEQDSCYQMVFTGEDLSNNPILNIGKYTAEQGSQMKVPTRQDTMGTFSDWKNLDTTYTGLETFFSFCIKSCEVPESGESPKIAGATSSGDCDFEVSHTVVHDIGFGVDGSITVSTSVSYDYIEFTDENGIIIQSGPDSVLDNLSAGIYCYTVWKDCCPNGRCAVIDDCSSLDNSIELVEGYNTCSNDTVTYALRFSGQNNPIDLQNYTVYWSSLVQDREYFSNPWTTLVEADTVQVYVTNLNTGCIIVDTILTLREEGYHLKYIDPEIGHRVQCSGQLGYILLENRMSTHDSILWVDDQSTTYNRYGLNSGEYCVQVFTGACDTVICMTVDSVLLDTCDFTVQTFIEDIDCQLSNVTIHTTGNDITTVFYDPQGLVIDSQATTLLQVDSLPKGDYTFKVFDDCCEYMDSFSINSFELCIVNEPRYCFFESDTVEINFCDSTLDLTDGSFTYEYEDYLGNSGNSNIIEDFLMHPSNFLIFTVADSAGCTFRDTISFSEVESPPSFEKNVEAVTTCKSGSIRLVPRTSGPPIDSFIWDDTGLQDTFRIIDSSGHYTYTAFYNGYCTEPGTVWVPFNTIDSINEEEIQITRPIKYCDSMLRYGNIVIDISDSVSASIDSFYWHDDPSIDSLNRTGLNGGTYCITYFIAGGCEQTKCFQVLTRIARPEVRVINSQMPECFDEGFSLCDGLLDISISWPAWLPADLRLPISSRWRHPNGTYIYLEDLVDQCPEEGNFILEIDYENVSCRQRYFFRICCCEWEAEGDINSPLLCDPGNPYPIIPPIQLSYNNPLTPTSQDGAIRISNIFPNPPKVITWSGPNGFHALNTSVIRNLVAGRYCVTVEVPGCSATRVKKCIDLMPCTQITINPNPTIEAPCMGDGGGSISLEPTGGQGPYSYDWISDPGGNSSVIDGINSGTYTVFIEERGGCEQTFDIEVLDTIVSFDSTSCEWVYESCGEEWRTSCNVDTFISEADCRKRYMLCECTGEIVADEFKQFTFTNENFDEDCNFELTCPWGNEIVTGFGYFSDEHEVATNGNECICYYRTYCQTLEYGPFRTSEDIVGIENCEDYSEWDATEVLIDEKSGLCGCYQVYYCGNSDRSVKTATFKDELDPRNCNITKDTITIFLEGEDGFLDCYEQPICISGENDTTYGQPNFLSEPFVGGWWWTSIDNDTTELSEYTCFRYVTCGFVSSNDPEVTGLDSIPARIEQVPDTTCQEGDPLYAIYCGDSLMDYSCSPNFGDWPPNEEKSKLTIKDGKDELLIYPNPTLDNITVLSSVGLRKLETYSVSGKLIKTRKISEQPKVFTTNLSLVNLPPGTYVLRIWTDDGMVTPRRVIKL